MSESSIREKFGISYLIPDEKETEIKRLRAALSSRDTEVREVLEGLRNLNGCWCVVTIGHSESCIRAQALYEKVQPTVPAPKDS